MTIPFYNFKDLHDSELINKIKSFHHEIFEENAFIEGKFHDLFQAEFSKQQQAKHCLLVANGTDAIEIALLAQGIKPGQKVGVPAITFYATAEAVLNIGAIPVIIDVDDKHALMDPASAERLQAKEKLSALIPVHIYGMPAPIKELSQVCPGIPIIEDAAQAQGGYYQDGEPIGSSGNLCTYSFYPTKNLGAFGDAGAILCEDSEMAKKIESLRNHGRSSTGVNFFGRNSRCDNLQAAVLYAKLDKLDAHNEARRNAAKEYISRLKDFPLRLPAEKMISLSSWHLFPIGLKDAAEKSRVSEFLAQKEIGTASHFYDMAMPDFPALKNCSGEWANAKNWVTHTLCLPMHSFLTTEAISEIADSFKQIYS